MKLYLSSNSFGDRVERLKNIIPVEPKIGIIPNAKDYKPNLHEIHQSMAEACSNILSVKADIIDLKKYFGKQQELEERINDLDLIRVQGGNTFVLRHAMKLSGMDSLLHKLYKNNSKIVYGGESAGSCVITPNLERIHLMDNPNLNPYGDVKDITRDGIGLINYAIIPHYLSTYGDGSMGRITQDIETGFKLNNIPYIALKDGEVIIIE